MEKAKKGSYSVLPEASLKLAELREVKQHEVTGREAPARRWPCEALKHARRKVEGLLEKVQCEIHEAKVQNLLREVWKVHEVQGHEVKVQLLLHCVVHHFFDHEVLHHELQIHDEVVQVAHPN